MKNILCGVIGASGYLGRQLTYYIDQCTLPIEIIHFSRKIQKFISGMHKQRNFDVLLNLGTPNEVVARIGGITAEKAVEEWSNHFEVAIRLAEPLQCIHISTFHIFGTPENALDDTSLIVGGNAYGDLHIRCLEFVKKICSELGIGLSIVVPTNIFGTVVPDLTPRTDLILNLAIERLRARQTLQLRSNGAGLRDFLWIEDAMQAFCAIISQTPVESRETIVVASEMATSVRDALKALFSVFGTGVFESWCELGGICETVTPLSVSCKKLRNLMGQWHSKSVLAAAFCQKAIFNSSARAML